MRQGIKSKKIDCGAFTISYLQRIYVLPENRGRGKAREMMVKWLAKRADHHVLLEAHPFGGEADSPGIKELTRFYRSLGFKSLRGTGFNLMYKGPSQ